ncbi:MAG: peptidoglycan DD-metalloendopeptidase family protein [Anaerolineales bacterium]
MYKNVRLCILLLVLVFPLAGFKTLPENQEEIHIIDDAVFHNVNAGLDLGSAGEAVDVLQEALEAHHPAWAKQTWEDYHGKERTLAYYLWNVSHAQLIRVNPRVLLVVVGVSLDWQIPVEGELSDAISDAGVALSNHYWEFKFRQDVRDRHPRIANPSTYALYAVLDYDSKKLDAWQQAYQGMFPKETSILSVRDLGTAFPRPFMSKPFEQLDAPTPFYTIFSYLDHDAPYDYDQGTLSRFDGFEFPGTLDECDAGKSCYSGHEGYDFDTGRDFPSTKPAIYPVADGTVTEVFGPCGQVEIKHGGKGVVTVYMHMEDIQVSVDDPVSTDTVLGYTGNVADGKNCKSTGAHLHFHAYAEGNSIAFIDPYGWWDVEGDSDPLETYTGDEKSGSAWLWKGDEAGDGYLIVDNSESQAQLFHLPNDREDGQTWWYDANGYRDGSWWTYSVKNEKKATNWAIWGTDIGQSGTYCVSAYWPRYDENTTSARYRIFGAGQGLIDTVVVDQNVEGSGWVPLREVDLETGPAVVILTDFVGSNGAAGRKVYFDAVKWEEGPCVSPSPTTPPGPTTTPTPPPGSSTIKVQVNQGTEDAGVEPGGCVYSTTYNEIYIGECDNGTLITSGFRFGDVPIPQGAKILEAYLEFTVDGFYDVPLLVRISGQDSGDAQPFSGTDQPSDRPQTAASAAWDIPSSEVWNLGDIHQSPELKDVVQEIVSRPDWDAYQGMAFILDTLSSAPRRHRRVIGYERPDWYPGTEHAARLVVTFRGTIPPTPPPSPTSPPPTPTPSPTPTPTPKPICPIEGLLDFLSSSSVSLSGAEAPRATGTPQVSSLSVAKRLTQAVDMIEFAPLLHQLRDEILAQTEEGQRYIALFEEHMTDISLILFPDQVLYQQGYDVLKSWESNLQAFVDGKGAQVTISEDQVSQVLDFLDALSEEANPELQEVIRNERERRPLEGLIGLSMDEAWNFVNGYELTWLSPVVKKDPYHTVPGSTIPVQFSIETQEGEFVEDDSVSLQVVNQAGEVVSGPHHVGRNPAKGITIQGKKYHLNVQTRGLEPGLYRVEVYYNAVDPEEPAAWNLLLKEK